MTDSTIESKLNTVWASKIDRINIDLIASKISMMIILDENEVSEKHGIVFEDVSSFFYVDRSTTKKKIPWLYAELSEIYYLHDEDHVIQHTQRKKGVINIHRSQISYLRFGHQLYLSEPKQLLSMENILNPIIIYNLFTSTQAI